MHPENELHRYAPAMEEAQAKLRRLQEKTVFDLKPPLEEDYIQSSEALLCLPESIRHYISMNELAQSVGFSVFIESVNLFDELRLLMLALEAGELPLALLLGYFQNKEITVTPIRAVKWLFAACALGLMITVFMIPGAAPLVGLILGVTSLITAGFDLKVALGERSKLRLEKKHNTFELQQTEKAIEDIVTQAKMLEAHMQGWMEMQAKAEFFQELLALEEEFNYHQSILYELKEKEQLLDWKLEKLQISEMIDKTISVAIAKLLIIGLSLSLVSPLGWYLLAGGIVIATVYLTAKLLIKGLQCLSNLTNPFAPSMLPKPEVELEELKLEFKSEDINPSKSILQSNLERNCLFHHNPTRCPLIEGDRPGQELVVNQ